MKNHLRIFSILLSLSMLLSGMPAFASETAPETEKAEAAAMETVEASPAAETVADALPAPEAPKAASAEVSAEASGAAPTEGTAGNPDGATANGSSENLNGTTTDGSAENPNGATADGSSENPGGATAEGSAESADVPPAEGSAEAEAGAATAENPAVESSDASASSSEEENAEDEQTAQLNEAVLQWIAALNGQAPDGDYARALWLYDRLIANVTPGAGDTAHAALVMGCAGGMGYALAYKALMDAAGLECQVVTSESGAWNIARLDGAWTHIDAYMDDAADSFGRHFALTDGAMARDHSLKELELPACKETADNYYVRSQGYLAYDGPEALHALLAAGMEAQAGELKLYNAGAEIEALEAEINATLAELAPATATVAQDGFLAVVQIHYDAIEVAEPAADAPVEAVAVLPESIVPASESLTLGVKEKVSVADWTMLPEGAQDSVSYVSKSTRIATVSADGVVTAKKAGSTTITIKAASGASCAVKVTVKKAPSSVSITGGRSVLGVGESVQLGYKLSNGSAGGAVFSCAGGAATITPDGLLTAVQPGTATITVTTFNGKKKSATVEVKAAPTSVHPALERVSIGAEDSWVLGYALNEGSAGAVRFDSSNLEIASVDASGRISALKQGEADVTITAYNGASGACHVTVVPAPTAVSLSAERTTLGVKEKLQLIPSIQPEGTMGTLKYASSKSAVVSVSADGVVTAKKAGSATITVSTYNGQKATLKLSVKKAPSSVNIAGGRTVFGVGESAQLDYKLSNGSAGGAAFSCAGGAATITPDGLLTAVQPGTATVTVTTFNGKKKSATVEVKSAPTSVHPALERVSIGAEDSWVLGYALNEGSAGAVYFASSDPEIASVDASGRISALKQGEADVTITAYNGASGTCHVTVVPAPTAVSLTAERTTLGMKEKMQLIPSIQPEGTMGTLKYTSSKSAVISVSADGVVTAKKTGSATITVSTYNGQKATLKLSVKKAPSSVSIAGGRSVFGVGESTQLDYKLPNGSAGGAVFSCAGDAATITPDGLLTAVQPGTATVTVTTFNGKKKSGTIEVKSAPTSVHPALDRVSIGAEDSWVLGYALNEGSAGAVYFASSDPEIASVDASGKISALKQGEADVTITAYNGASGTCHVTVVPAPTAVSLSAERTALGVKEKLQLVPSIQPEGTMGTLKYASSKSAVISVTADGVVTAKKVGSATITVSTYNGQKATLKLSVKKAPSSVSITGGRSVLGVGENVQLGYKLPNGSAGGAVFSCAGDAATITPDGLLTAVQPGTATITVTTFNGKKKSGTVEVIPGPTDIHLSAENISIGRGDSYAFHAEMNAGAPGTYSFASSNPEVAAIDPETGLLTAVAEGQATITATTYNGLSDSAAVTVLPAPSILALEELPQDASGDYLLTLYKGEAWDIRPALPGYSDISLDYASTNANVASVDGAGHIQALRSGSAQIVVRCYNGIFARIQVSVQKWTDDYDPFIIVHAMGSIDGNTYSNSLEAFEANYARGHRFFEVDFNYTSDGELVLWHDWGKNQINSFWPAGYVPTKAEFTSSKIYDKYTPMCLEDLIALMKAYPDIRVFADTKNPNTATVKKQFAQIVSTAKEICAEEVLHRFVVELYSKSMYNTVESVYHFDNYLFSLYNLYSKAPTTSQLKEIASFCNQRAIDMVAMPYYWWKPEYAAVLRKYDLSAGLHTVNSSSAAQRYLSEGVKAICSDSLPPL